MSIYKFTSNAFKLIPRLKYFLTAGLDFVTQILIANISFELGADELGVRSSCINGWADSGDALMSWKSS